MFHIAICDDDKIFIKNFERLLIKAGIDKKEVLFYEYRSGEQLVKNLKWQENCDLLILDMKMGRLNGNQTAARFRERFPKSVLVFCSGVCQPTDESFKTFPFRYLLKDYPEGKMLGELRTVIKELRCNKKSPCIAGKNYCNIVKLQPEEILFIENAKYGSNIYVHSNSVYSGYDAYFKTDKKLAQLYAVLEHYGFAYAHNSYIVNLDYVTNMKSAGEITLDDGTVLSVARSKLKSFREKFYDRIEKRP